MEGSKILKISSFILKIIAILSMTVDHLGVIINSFYPDLNTLYTVCRYIGRLALPLFCFMIVEGVIHTKDIKKYVIRLGIMAVVIAIILAVFEYVPSLGLKELSFQGNIFMDLLLGALMLWALSQKENKKLRFLALIPIAISILSFVAKGIETSSYYTMEAYWYPQFLRLQYDWLSVLMILGFYGASYFADTYFEYQSQYSGLELDQVKGTATYRLAVNLISMTVVMGLNIVYYLFKYFAPTIVFWAPNVQIAGMAAGILLIFYNGKRGYNGKWFQYGSYLYYPIHILLLYGIVYLISLL
ncbi:MAG: hypothetical protein E7181_00080 [Erysipelotrichaceae bacterium]|nr:hypothetical protein [Erysipelotrichaceae bacterium]